MDANTDVRRRIKAARELAGLTVVALAARINSERLGAKAIGSLERGDRKTPPQPHELEAIAKACGLPVAFFMVDFARLPEIAPPSDEVERVEGEIAEAIWASGDAHAADQVDQGTRLRELVDRMEELKAELEVLKADQTRALVDFTRRTKQALSEGLPPVPGEETPAAADTRDEADATQGSAQAPAQGTRGTA